MPKRNFEVLDFPHIRNILAGFCQTRLGKELAFGMSPRSDSEWVKGEFDRVEELLSLGVEPDLSGISDVHVLLRRARKGAMLTGEELLRVKQICAGIHRCRWFCSLRHKQAPRVWLLARGLVEQEELEQDIEESLGDTGEVRDSATPRLEETRQELRRRRNRLVSRLEKMVTENPGWFTDRPTVKRNRFVLPLRVEFRDRLPGVIHESSDSGHTFFVEPMDTVREQNKIAELRGVEVEEVARVLRFLSEKAAQSEAALSLSLDILGRIDLLVAKRRFTLKFDCTRPEIAEDGRIKLVAGRHPLLVQRKSGVVPLDFGFPDSAQVVLISGPNAGGKTVAIKTLGLLSLMMGCGIFLPVNDGTALPLFDEVFADIGDEQSLDSDLSSFTAHMMRIKGILEGAGEHSLVLLDEIGSSTAPEEGTVLAIAVLESLRDRGIQTVATSHFGALKLFVQDEPGMVNAAMGFRNGRPTYRLTMGFPGESSAFEIAASAGLPDDLLKRAKSRLGSDWLDLSAKLRALNEELEQVRKLRQTTTEEQKRVEKLRLEYEENSARLEQWVIDEQERLRIEQETFLKETRRKVENLVRAIKESQAERATVIEAKKFIEDRLKQVKPVAVEREKNQAAPQLAVGDLVESRMFQRRGVVAEVKHDNVTVTFGRVRMQLQPDDLVPVQSEMTQGGEISVAEDYKFESRLSIRGMTREQASLAVSRFLDEASCFGAKQVSILHGKGTGVLQKMLWNRLRRNPQVEEFRFGENYEGGTGITLITLRTGDD
ncbi:hypothetical protein CH330_09215 [candidate division WOR-3 bacterium JGI_Cruoil_03_51_56]|uniref:Endonuclease MutS2 n=1 Tax=candidate division WOR-3 bacterium JGI_Cruoil_03_51_56 TaxID=1973747 RepID=A0A235BPD6_UNCW3|nr:MAG: hypothetical protein CH330_09215 [candidate division WOR-3 bacterium JGI_Cruoil_03_51_56]